MTRDVNDSDAIKVSGFTNWLVQEFGPERAFKIMMSCAILVLDEYGHLWFKKHGVVIDSEICGYKVVMKKTSTIKEEAAKPPCILSDNHDI